MGTGTVYRCSDGRYYGDVDVWNRLEAGAWTPCCWDEAFGREWMETGDRELLVLVPVPRSALPAGTRLDHLAGGVSVVSGTPGDERSVAPGSTGREPTG